VAGVITATNPIKTQKNSTTSGVAPFMRCAGAECHDSEVKPPGRAATPAAHVTRQRRSWIERSSLADELYRTGYALTIEHLVSWLIHEISQPLMASVATTQAARRLLGRRRPNLREIGQSIEEVMAYQRRAGKIIQRLRTVLPSVSRNARAWM
jgi:C4-dicarboxylate-specific signal transduction histidine kinase